MIDALHKVLTDSTARDNGAVQSTLAQNSEVAIAWFD